MNKDFLIPISLMMTCIVLVMQPVAWAAEKKKKESNNTPRVEMINPSGDPTKSAEAVEGKNEFTFNTGIPGVLTIRCEAKLTPDNAKTRAWAEDNVEWSVTAIAGSTQTWVDSEGNPADNKGREVFCRFTGLPALNSEFGAKTVTMTANQQTTSRIIEVFFPIRHPQLTSLYNITNHPLINGDSENQAGTPNWYFYWFQIPAVKVGKPGPEFDEETTHIYVPGEHTGITHYSPYPDDNTKYKWTARVASRACRSLDLGIWNNASGIDLFANILRHEYQHLLDMTHPDNWGNGPILATEDGDSDFLRHDLPNKTYETDITPPQPRESTYPPNTIVNKYSPTHIATYVDDRYNYVATNSPLNDAEDYALGRQTAWTKGAANASDWANPGMQHGTNDDPSD